MAEHAFRRIKRDLKDGQTKSLVLLYGKEQYLVDWAVNLLVSEYINDSAKQMDYTVFDSDMVQVSDIENACETLPILSERHIVEVRFSKKSVLKPADLVPYSDNIPKETLLILNFNSEEIDKKLIDEFKIKGNIYNFSSLDERLFTAFIDKRVKEDGKSISISAVKEFIYISGYMQRDSNYTLYNAENDLKKLLAYATDSEIKVEDIENVVVGSIEKNIFAMTDAVSRNRKEDAYELLNNLLSEGESVYQILGMLITQFETMLSVKELREKSMNAQQIQKALKIHEYRVKKAIPPADRYSIADLKQILLNAYSIDREIKTGTIDGVLAVEMLIAEI